MMDGHGNLFEHCKSVLQQNYVGGWTKPTAHLYPHQWLWDSCFIAIGQRHYDVKQAQNEIRNLFRGQWKNGMVPNVIYGTEKRYSDDIWKSHVSKNAPKNIKTSGITQPPMIAEAVVKIGEKLSKSARHAWYKSVYTDLLAYHEWIYRERDPHGEGLAVLVHPWECGLDNTPTWISEMQLNDMPLWIKSIQFLKLNRIIDIVRKDSTFLSAQQRITTINALNFYSIARRLRRKRYETRLILRHAHLSIEDLAFNAILIRANEQLKTIAEAINENIPGWLLERMRRAPHALELLWSEQKGQYFSRSFDTFELITEPSIMTFLPLYAGTISKQKAAELVRLMKTNSWTTRYPLSSVPKGSNYFQPNRYWQGPTWINTNWLIIEGLKRYGYTAEAAHIAKKSIELVKTHGCFEYFNPHSGKPLGAHNFSWTAALTIDLLTQ